jgi:MFS family permease
VTAETSTPGDRQSNRFLLLYALAYAGGFVAYVPLLTILLPVKMAVAAGAARVEWLAAATLLGAIAASVANVGFGWASDLTRSRRPWIWAGLGLTIVTYGLLHLAQTPAAIVAGIVAWQCALNLMLSPLAALAADHVPDHQKGVLGGLLGAGAPIGAFATVLVTLPGVSGEGTQFALTCAMIAALLLPLLLIGRARPVTIDQAPPPMGAARTLRHIDLGLMWFARLLVQIAGSVLFGFLLYYFQSLPGEAASPAMVARLGGATMVAAVPLALLLGRASDRIGARRPFLIGTALAMTAGLAGMAVIPALPIAIAAYALFGGGCSIFLALHSVYAMQMLPSADRRGRDLGLFNLTNTLPSILSPLLAIALVPGRGFGMLMATLAVLTTLAAMLIAMVRSERLKTA